MFCFFVAIEKLLIGALGANRNYLFWVRRRKVSPLNPRSGKQIAKLGRHGYQIRLLYDGVIVHEAKPESQCVLNRSNTFFHVIATQHDFDR